MIDWQLVSLQNHFFNVSVNCLGEKISIDQVENAFTLTKQKFIEKKSKNL
jgi:hypothetical protein